MLVLCLIFSLLSLNELSYCVTVTLLDQPQNNDNKIKCVTNILERYFSPHREVTYVAMNSNDDDVLKMLNTVNISIVTRHAKRQSRFPHRSYLVLAANINDFSDNVIFLQRELVWNPYARFLIVIQSLDKEELKKAFDVLLGMRVNNVVIIDSANENQLYTYNPFDKYACGKYYETIIEYGRCLLANNIDLYPNKLVTGLKNCTFTATIPNRPPYTVDTSKFPNISKPLMTGVEQYIFQILGDIENFNVNFSYDYPEQYSTINTDMKIDGPMKKLQVNETDAMFGSVILVSIRAKAFSILTGHLDYIDDLRHTVKRAAHVPNWKLFYMEFGTAVWSLLLIVIFVYSMMMILLLKSKDKVRIMLKLFDSLLGQGYGRIRGNTSVMCIFIIWMWFAYLANTFYQSSLVSLTTNPVKEYQISTEKDLVSYKLVPCISPGLYTYISSENNLTSLDMAIGCENPFENVRIVARSKKYFTLTQLSLFLYNKKFFYDKYGRSKVYYFSKPYSKFIFAILFYKGFPISDKMRSSMIRFRESGIVTKKIEDHYYARKIQFHFHNKEYESKFAVPWIVYGVGVALATVAFVIELIVKHTISANWLTRVERIRIAAGHTH